MSLAKRSVKELISTDEWNARVDLAACFRIADHYGMTDHIFTHISARVPGFDEQVLMNPFGTLFGEITASSLLKVDLNGKVLQDETGLGLNPTGFLIHKAVYEVRPDVRCVIHTHSIAGVAVSAQESGLQPLSQQAARYMGRVGYHTYEGLIQNREEKERLIRNLGKHPVLILRNHGLLTCGASVAEAFEHMYFVERACQAQVLAQSTRSPLIAIEPAVVDATIAYYLRADRPVEGRDWAASLRTVRRYSPDYCE
jgi:ribulose-5-phosphate 4-epimerase/fuculose-1-phosphate aldolase